MNKFLLFVIATFLSLPCLFAQSPLYIPYQAVARNAAGNLLVNQQVGLQFTILKNSASGTVVYQETQTTRTNSLGLFNVNIGNGTPTPVSGSFSSIPWGTNTIYTDVQIDPNGSTNYVDVGATQMMSVPYALYAGSASSVALTQGSGITVSGDAVSETLPVTSLTTTGSGAATISSGVLNIPNYLSNLTFSNGITSTNGNSPSVTLGGALTQTTVITQGAYMLTHNLTGTGDLEVEENSNPSLYVLGAHSAATDGYVGIGTNSPVSPLNLSVNGTSSLFNGVLDVYQPNLAAGTSSSVYLKLGVSATSNNEADVVFNYAGSGSSSNSLGIGFNGSYPIADFYANGNVSIGNLSGDGYRPVYASANGTLVTSFGQPTLAAITVTTTRKTFQYTGSDQTWVVPTGVTQIYVKLWGAGGGGGNSAVYNAAGPGGGGGFVSGILSVSSGETLTIVVGQGGQTDVAENTTTYGGGGEVTCSNPNTTQFPNGILGNGGGRTAIRNGASGNSAYVDLVTAGAGGGGGGVSSNGDGGGGGGGTTGANGGGDDYGYGGGQTLASSTGCGTRGTLGQGGNGCSYKWAAGGGGGYYGGAGGGYAGTGNGPGGGGSSYVANLTAPITTTTNSGTYGFTFSSTVQNTQGATWSGGSNGTTAATTAPAAGGNSDFDYTYTSSAGAGGLQSSSTSTTLSGNPGYVVIYY